MNVIKHFLILAFLITYARSSTQAQTIDCKTDFWTITSDGYIQQWSLSNEIVNGGDTILSGGGTSLSYCGSSDAPTFFSNNYSPIGITYFDSDSGWIDIPTPVVVDNNGGHLNDQYYMNEGGIIQVIKYWDGTNLFTVDSLNGEFFASTFDIGVDTLGQAWVFTGPTPSTVDSLKVYNQNGKINAYSIQFNQIAYGAFFLNYQLYIGTDQDSIFPVLLNGSKAHLGNSIPFSTSNFTDMASCQKTESITSIGEHPKTEIKLFPNPTSGYLILPLDIERSSISVYNSQGQLIKSTFKGTVLDLTEQKSGMYFIRIKKETWSSFHKIIKL